MSNEDGLDIPPFLKRPKPKKRLEIVPEIERTVNWAPISHTKRRSAVMENMRRLATRPEAPVFAMVREGDRETEKKFRNIDAFLDDFYNERVHKYLGMNSSEKSTIIFIDASAEVKMRRRFEDLKSRHNPVSVSSKGDGTMSSEATTTTKKKAAVKKAAKPKAAVKKAAKPKVEKLVRVKPERKMISDPRYDGKKLTRILQRDLPEGTKPLQKTSPHWTAYIYVARKPGVTFESYANDAKHSIASLTTLVEAGHVVLK